MQALLLVVLFVVRGGRRQLPDRDAKSRTECGLEQVVVVAGRYDTRRIRRCCCAGDRQGCLVRVTVDAIAVVEGAAVWVAADGRNARKQRWHQW